MKKLCFLFIVISCCLQCKTDRKIQTDFQSLDPKSEWVHFYLEKLNDAVVNDIFSPPVASRIYAYTFMSGYTPFNNMADSNIFENLNTSINLSKQDTSEVDSYLASLFAMAKVGSELVFSSDYIQSYQDSLEQFLLDKNYDKKRMESSQAYGDSIYTFYLKHFISRDGYAETRTMPRYEINKKEEGRWIPTPPDFLDAIEPHWNQISPLFLDSASQFRPTVLPGYDLDKGSDFYKDLTELYKYTRDSLDAEKKEIAEFWDCNPFVTEHVGHYMKGVKKITPGGHWVGINKIVTKEMGLDPTRTLKSYAMLCMGMMDAFISCWDEKYRSSLIRPETLINLHLDPEWKPLLITPPFPEYTSGHSVVSGTASTILTTIHGDNVAFIDDTEVPFGLPIRNFNSFNEAANEAAISRYYGGIHYRPAIFVGLEQGKKIGSFVLEKFEN